MKPFSIASVREFSAAISRVSSSLCGLGAIGIVNVN
jgi:hypothetical protein